MKLINPDVTILPQSKGLEGVYKQIEIAGRTCYKSEDKITEDSCEEFVRRMINNGHTAMLEHGTVYLECPPAVYNKYTKNKYSSCTVYSTGQQPIQFINKSIGYIAKSQIYYVTTNLRVLVENEWLDDLKYVCAPTSHHEKRITVRFTCDRGVSHELVRHRVFSFAQESSRYCNYSKGKFGGEITYITPSWWDNANDSVKSLFLDSLSTAEDCYLEMLDNGCKAQEARQVLPNALKTEVVMTGFESDWKHFFDLRCAPSAHPDMQVLAKKLQSLMKI